MGNPNENFKNPMEAAIPKQSKFYTHLRAFLLTTFVDDFFVITDWKILKMHMFKAFY